MQNLQILETKKSTWIVKSSIGWFSTQVKTNNMSLIVTSYTTPLTASNALILGHKFEQHRLLILKTRARNNKNKVK